MTIRDFISNEGFLAVDSSLYPKLREDLKRLAFATTIDEAWEFDRHVLSMQMPRMVVRKTNVALWGTESVLKSIPTTVAGCMHSTETRMRTASRTTGRTCVNLQVTERSRNQQG